LWKRWEAEKDRTVIEEIRRLDYYPIRNIAIALICEDHDYTVPPYAPKPYSGLIEQQRLFMKALKRD